MRRSRTIPAIPQPWESRLSGEKSLSAKQSRGRSSSRQPLSSQFLPPGPGTAPALQVPQESAWLLRRSAPMPPRANRQPRSRSIRILSVVFSVFQSDSAVPDVFRLP